MSDRHLDLTILKLGEYQEQAYLLDPFLEKLVTPVVEQLKVSIANTPSKQNSENLGFLATQLYQYINFRGYKAISEPACLFRKLKIVQTTAYVQHASSLTKLPIYPLRSIF